MDCGQTDHLGQVKTDARGGGGVRGGGVEVVTNAWEVEESPTMNSALKKIYRGCLFPDCLVNFDRAGPDKVEL